MSNSSLERLFAHMKRYNWAGLTVNGVRVRPGELAWRHFAKEHADQIEADLARIEAHVRREQGGQR